MCVCEQYYCKSNQPVPLKLDLMVGPTNRNNWLTFGHDPILETDSGSLFHFPHHCAIGDFMTFISISHTVEGQFFTTLGEMTDAYKLMNPRHFGIDLANIWIWMRIIPKILIWIADYYLWLRFWLWWRFLFSDHSLIEFSDHSFTRVMTNSSLRKCSHSVIPRSIYVSSRMWLVLCCCHIYSCWDIAYEVGVGVKISNRGLHGPGGPRAGPGREIN